ncbi:MAG TPA: hypothetical protein VFK92_06950 [Burkholderiales bacterium]|nr:hypothetical protein [Burkholderiales bacterium]
MKLKIIAVVLLPWLAASALAADRADLEGTQILGNRELPKVLYIVPWKQPLQTELVGRPASSVLDEALSPVDREVFERQVHYHSLMHPAPSEAPPRDSGGGAK